MRRFRGLFSDVEKNEWYRYGLQRALLMNMRLPFNESKTYNELTETKELAHLPKNLILKKPVCLLVNLLRL